MLVAVSSAFIIVNGAAAYVHEVMIFFTFLKQLFHFNLLKIFSVADPIGYKINNKVNWK